MRRPGWLRRATTARHAVPVCEACATRDEALAVQRTELYELRDAVADLRADAVQNLHALFTLHLVEYAAVHDDQLGGDPRRPDQIREYALTFMAECFGLDTGARVLVGDPGQDHTRGEQVVRLPGTVRDVWLDGCGQPVLFVAMDNLSDITRLIAAGYEVADADLPGGLDGRGLVVVPFPATRQPIGAGGWIEATA
jgi:hypothetical protein